ncbi:hypothetical protein V493_06645 [Pseudogymnoascus sp. VKM F-4281 (FW-2241)]|nr:hypothetical protein V493_06645 [Pseudogymnoascus sp. VKM F-4281 (FW-2241)]
MASQPHQEPPSYSEVPPSASTHIPVEPPTYDDVAESQPRDQLMTGELPCLIMDDCLIYAELQPKNPLYELSNPPTSDRSAAFAVEKIIYRLSTNDGEGALRQRKRHLYDFRSGMSAETGDVVSLVPKANSKFAFKDIQLHHGIVSAGTSWGSCKADGHFRAGKSVKLKLSRKDEFEWKDWDGRLVAVETKVTRTEDGKVVRPPRLELKVAIDEKEFDLLVTLWAARVWRESLKDLAEPFSWSKFKRITEGTGGSTSGLLPFGFGRPIPTLICSLGPDTAEDPMGDLSGE